MRPREPRTPHAPAGRVARAGCPRRTVAGVFIALAFVAVSSVAALAPGSPAGGQAVQPPFEEFTAGYAVNGTYRPIVGRFSGPDGREDILWYAPGSTPESLWQATASRTARFTKVPVPSVNGTYVPIVGDFSSDGYDDIIWYGPGSAPDTLWNFTSSGLTTRALSINGTFTPLVLPNLTLPDSVLWYAPGTATDWLWAFEPGATLVQRGDPADGLYFLLRGQVSVVVDLPGGGHKRLSTLTAGMSFGELGLLTGGRPDFIDTSVPAGTTDLLVSYTYRIAFTDSGQNFGLAAAISTIIFIMVAVMALIQLKLTHKEKR